MVDDSHKPIERTADEARGAEVILRKRRSRAIFIGGLVLFLILAVAGFGFST